MPSSQNPSRARNSRPPQRVRIIGGRWKRTPLAVLDVEGLRPTPDRVRETVFNWINHLRGGSFAGMRVLDLFAGTGALGFEAASRGAASVILVDRAPAVRTLLEATRARLAAEGVEVWSGDAMAALARAERQSLRFDLVFLDPPFQEDWLERVVTPALALLAPDGLLYIEAGRELDAADAFAADLEVVRTDKAGQVFYHLLRRKADPDSLESTSC